MRRMRGNAEGIEGLPLKLLMVAIVMGIAFPSVMAMWANVERAQVENRVLSELDYLMMRIGQVHRYGPGNAVSVEFNLESGFMTSVDYVRVGDNLTSEWRSTIRWKLSGEGENVLLIEDETPVCGTNGEAFEVGEGQSSLYLETKKKENGLVYVEISVLD